MKSVLCPLKLETTLRCQVAAAALLRGSMETIAQGRRQAALLGTEKLASSFLKHAEDQTVLALMTVRAALEQQGWQGKSFADWGVIAAPNLFGRVSISQTIQRYQQEGAWGISPHLIPHQSLHAMSGTISQALKICGPNFGVGGGPNAGPDALLIAAAMMSDGSLPGLWVVLTGYETEWIPSTAGATPAPICGAVAFALTTASLGNTGIHLSFGQAPTEADVDSAWPEFQLGLLAEEWTLQGRVPSGRWRLSDTHWAEFAGEARP